MSNVPKLLAVTTVTLLLTASAAQAAFTTPTCLAKKRQAQGKLQQCRATEEAKALQGKTPNVAKCTTKFQEQIAKLSAKAGKAEIGCRYGDNGDGTVSDYDTGLQWEKKDSAGGGGSAANPHDVDNIYSWGSVTGEAEGAAFVNFLSRLNACSVPNGIGFSSAGFAGHCDWRLPTLAELQAILLESDPCGTSPCIDPIFGPTATDTYWTSTTNANLVAHAWNVSFVTGNLTTTIKPLSWRVRAVRGGL